jgi:hypothetical protein
MLMMLPLLMLLLFFATDVVVARVIIDIVAIVDVAVGTALK